MTDEQIEKGKASFVIEGEDSLDDISFRCGVKWAEKGDRALGFSKLALKCLLDYQELLQDISHSRVGYMGDHSVYCENTFRVDRTRGKLEFLKDLLKSEFASELKELQDNDK
jgi:hypothetical protein